VSRVIDRRSFAGKVGLAVGPALWFGARLSDPSSRTPAPIRAITRGPRFHWFAYYDKLEFDLTDRYVLGMEVDFEHRSPKADDRIGVGMVDIRDGDRWIGLGQTAAWNWQQGCHLQFRPGFQDEVVWNDREDGRYVCRILNLKSSKRRTIGSPIYSLSPDGKTALTVDFERIQDMRPGYGYAGLPDPNRDSKAPDNAGIYRIDMETGERKLIVSIRQLASIPFPGDDLSMAKHWFNHLLFNTDGSRFVFLHRWQGPDSRVRYPKGGGFGTRMVTARFDGTDMRIVDPHGFTSHFIWRDPTHILAWAKHPSHDFAFYLFEDGSDRVDVVGKGAMSVNGHCSYLPGNEWILSDTYPDSKRLQHVYLYHVPSGRKVELASLFSPPEYAGEWRCDTHPRFSRTGRFVAVDSPHEGRGRQIYLIDIGRLIS
jgi:hypothetical protein